MKHEGLEDYELLEDEELEAENDRRRVAPGKQTITSMLKVGGAPRPTVGGAGRERDGGRGLVATADQKHTVAVQREASHAAEAEPFGVHLLARQGVAGGGGELPHLPSIQQSFGHHDVTSVRAHVGGSAAKAAAAIGAEAYASGDDVAFAGTPDLRQASHEAAHVVQQRGGVRLDGGVGTAGDPYEQHADAVADLVVRGESAEPLLDTMAHRGAAGGPAVGASTAPSVQMDGHRPIRERTIRFRVTAPEDYDTLREAIEAQLARDVMSRTEVEQPDGSEAPIRREHTLVEGSNLHELYGTLQPGDRYELTARLLPGPGGYSYQQLVFSLPEADHEGEEIRVEGRTGVAQLATPDYTPPTQVPDREDRWRRAQEMLEERLDGQVVGSGPDQMWTPTRTCISRMMPAVVSATSTGSGGDAVPHGVQRTSPGWQAMPTPHHDTVRVFGRMLISRFGADRMGGAGELTDEAMAAVTDEFVRTARGAIEMRNDRRRRLEVFQQMGGGAMVGRDLAAYRSAELRLFVGDPTCLWRYVD